MGAVASLDRSGIPRRRGGGGHGGQGGPDYHDGAELVVRGSPGRRTQIARARVRQWSPRVEARFLRALGQTCNVKAACAEVGMTPASAYGHRGRWQGFAERWAEALEHGYVQIEMALLQAAGNFLSPDEIELPDGITGMTVDRAIYLLHMHKHQVRLLGGRPGRYKSCIDHLEREKASASILRKIEAIERHRKLQQAIEEKGEPGPTAWAAFRAEEQASDAGRDGERGPVP
ncbi:MAG: hypothetical protein J0G94_01955 [Sphingomonadales bacterium]|nr:hypothetical protein [Sphingomonadales bacterium]